MSALGPYAAEPRTSYPHTPRMGRACVIDTEAILPRASLVVP